MVARPSQKWQEACKGNGKGKVCRCWEGCMNQEAEGREGRWGNKGKAKARWCGCACKGKEPAKMAGVAGKERR